MENRNACEDPEVILERLIRIENSLFRLKLVSECFPAWDNTEVERLEGLRLELRDRYESATLPAFSQ